MKSTTEILSESMNGSMKGAPNSTFNGLRAVGFLAKDSYALAGTPVLALLTAYLGADPEAIAFAVAIFTATGILRSFNRITGSGADSRFFFTVVSCSLDSDSSSSFPNETVESDKSGTTQIVNRKQARQLSCSAPMQRRTDEMPG